ncbi:MAG: hypothetical protein EA352_06555 [Gemmatimonadales bacterium]|nr:MAG: hypothetical protein EA352_06555 [Gemmatimonadales bacterium]
MRTPVLHPRAALLGLFLLFGGLLGPSMASPALGQDLEGDPIFQELDLALDIQFSDPDLLEQIACLRESLDGDLRQCTWSEGIQECRADTYDSEAQCLMTAQTFLDRAQCRILGILDEAACLPLIGWLLEVV